MFDIVLKNPGGGFNINLAAPVTSTPFMYWGAKM